MSVAVLDIVRATLTKIPEKIATNETKKNIFINLSCITPCVNSELFQPIPGNKCLIRLTFTLRISYSNGQHMHGWKPSGKCKIYQTFISCFCILIHCVAIDFSLILSKYLCVLQVCLHFLCGVSDALWT